MMNTRAIPFFHESLMTFPDGAHERTYLDRRYLVCKETLLGGRVVKLYAKELGGNDFVSLNYYPKTAQGLLKPCEMSDDKVIDFVCGSAVIMAVSEEKSS